MYDVYLSFRGEDTRHNFMSHLYNALSRLQVRTFMDHEFEGGDEIPPALLTVIQEAKVLVIVFSENYASSQRCLNELVRIMERQTQNGQIIVPIFYHVDPTQVRNQTGSYAEAFARHEQRLVGNMNAVQQWRLALAEAANISGWDCSAARTEFMLVDRIAADVLQKLDSSRQQGI